MSYPLHRLKVIKNPSDLTSESLEEEKIVDKRTVYNETEYLVKWKDCPDEEKTWLKKKHFNSMEPILDYEKKLNNKVEKKKRGRQPKVKQVNLLSIVAIFLSIFKLIFASKIQGDFHYCDHEKNNNVFLALENSCSAFVVSTRNKIISCGEIWYLALLIKQKHFIYGTGFKFKKEIKTATFRESFLGYQTESSKSHYVQLSKEECEYMVKTKICNGFPMICENENCFYEKEPEEEFNWWKTVTRSGVKCSVTAIGINGDSLDQRLFNSIKHPCKASSLELPLHHSIIIWVSKIIHKCPYELVDKVELRSLNDNIVVNENEGILLQVTSSSYKCVAIVYKNQEGFYLNRGIIPYI
ncbi:unnamed protein product [Brachionus calyciflorus]|uniref:Chromo domain-containing protein n=1 Tax=Brachionus calyciflorus TaxID=104777 RepID=A0A814I9S5_9BILA|nr:unnamed protein product [Brachionus calyciflorus]